MANDEEFRKVAEDIRALARSLAKDFRDAVDHSRDSGQPIPRAFRHGLRGVAEEARRGARSGWKSHHSYRQYRRAYRHYSWWDPYGRPYPPPPPGAVGTPPAPDPNDPSGRYEQSANSSWNGPSNPAGPYDQPWAGHHHRAAHRSRHPRSTRRALPPVRRRWDATTVVGMLAVLFGVAWLLGAVQAIHVSVEAVVAIGLMLLGASLIVTGRTDWSLSRHGWPVWLGIGLIAVLLATSATFGVGGAFGSVSFGHMTATPIGSQVVHGGFGKLQVDASGLDHGQVLQVDSVAGETDVELPADVPVEVNARVLAGQICIDGQSVAAGVGATATRLVDPGPQTPVQLDVHQVAGLIQIGGSGCRSQ